MIYEVKIHRDTILFQLVAHYLVCASSGEKAAKFALDKAIKDYPEEKRLRVCSVHEMEGTFVGKAA